MYVITYSLRNNQVNSDQFYPELAVFTDEVLAQAEELARPLIKAFQSYMEANGKEKLRSFEEYILDLLTLGTLWRVYSGDASGLEGVPGQLLTALAKLRRQGESLKPGIDFLRGIMGTLFLSPDLYDNMFTLGPTVSHLEKLLNWLEATGEFSHEVKRLRNWQGFLAALPANEAPDVIGTAITLATWFELRSEEVLGAYTPNVERFLNEARPGHYWHEDVIFCGRRRVEYHLNMVGAEIMNRAFRDAFLKTGHKVVLLPACTRLLPAAKCRADATRGSFRCAGCCNDCTVNHLTRLGETYGFDVIVVPHESSISAGVTKSRLIGEDTGIVGVACVLNLLSGGWALQEMNIPAQCVFLDYCGCKNHWHKEGIPTEINVNQLKHILGIHGKGI